MKKSLKPRITLHQYLYHLWQWFRMFPVWWESADGDDCHLWIASVGSGNWECFGCGAKFFDPDDVESEEELAEIAEAAKE